MSIPVQEIVTRALADLDAEGSQRYLFDQDFKPAIKYAQEWLVTALNKIFDTTKHSGESLRELVKIGIWQTNNFSRIAFDETVVGHKLWSVLALYPNPVTTPFSIPVPPNPPAASRYMANLSFVSGKSCTNRLTLEQWGDNVDNVFMPGNNILNGLLAEFAYLNFANYSSGTYNNPGTFELELRPALVGKYVGMAYLKRPSDITLITDSLQFPDNMIDIILEKTLNHIAQKQGDQTTLYLVTDRDINRLIPLLQ